MRVNNGLTPQESEAYGISDVHDIVYNPSYDLLYQEELDPSLTGYERGVLTNLGAVAVDTGIFTGRSPKIRISSVTIPLAILSGGQTKAKVRTTTNLSLPAETWQHLKGLVTKQLSGKRLFVVDAFCGANPDTVFPSVSSPKRPGQRILSKTCLFARAMKSWQVSNQTLSL